MSSLQERIAALADFIAQLRELERLREIVREAELWAAPESRRIHVEKERASR
jgi:hypothetical protein